MKTIKLLSALALAGAVFFAGCSKDEIAPASLKSGLRKASVQVTVPLGVASSFAVLAGTEVTNSDASIITGDLGVSPGTSITGFQPEPLNTIIGPGTVTPGLGIVTGIIYAGDPVAAQAHLDAGIAYNFLKEQVPAPGNIYSGEGYQLNGLTFTPGVYSFASANLKVDGIVYLDFQGNSDALFIFQMSTTLVTMGGSKVVAINTNSSKKCTDPKPDPQPDPQSCLGSNVYWAVGSSATIDGAEFIGTVIAYTAITMTSAENIPAVTNVSGRMLALGANVTMVNSNISVCGSGGTVPPEPPVPPVKICRDFVTGGGWINNKATFGVTGGIKNGRLWGQLSYNDHSKKNSVKVKSTKVTAYIVKDAVTRQIEGIAWLNGKTKVDYKVIVVDNGEPGRNDSFSIELSNGYNASGTLKGGNIQLHIICYDKKDRGNNWNDDGDDDGDDDDDDEDDDD